MDEGGVQKEFFQLITPMLFNKDFGPLPPPWAHTAPTHSTHTYTRRGSVIRASTVAV